MIRNLFIATAFVAVTCLAVAPVSAQIGQGNSANNLFSQYVTPDGPNTTTAGMYPAPHYVPPMGGQAYYTYQPLMPHEMMYQHSRNYYNYYNTGGFYGGCGQNGMNKTSVKWHSGVNHMAPMLFSRGRGDLRYRMQNHRYGINKDCPEGDCGPPPRGLRKGGLGCSDGNCGSCDTCESGCTDGGCAGGCAANLSDNTMRR